MYLKSIEIQGFKSFAHKTLLNFNNGVTGIVGPNGSGKSNISDAVRWVLGEQKVKQLRGSAMQDVIFAGTELRKAQGFAYVAITLDNSDHVLPIDYTEVTVSRRLFRSGESDYMINGQSVRLKDIQELFYDTGIGKEGYSIIGQGQIDAIINGRPRDRRGLFDEAAGIVKFKKRKAAAVRRLESERESLVRVTDIINELEKRLHPLERQAESAKHYLKLREDQKRLDLNLFVRQTEAILDNLEKSKGNLSIAKASLAETEEECDRLKESGSAIGDEIAKLDEQIEKDKSELSKAELLKENLNGQINVNEARIKADTENQSRNAERVKVLRAELDENVETARRYLKTIDELETSLEAMNRGSEDDELAPDFTDALVLKSEAGRFREKLAAAGIEKSDAASEDRDGVSSESDIHNGDAEEADEDEDAFVLPDWMRAIRNKRDDLAEIREKEARTSEWLDKAEDEYNALTRESKKYEAELNEAQNRYTSLNARLESIRNLAERYEGYGESIRAVMREKKRFGGIKGVVADLISTKKEYETAVETALGGRLQNIVTDNERSAKACIEYLKKTRQGRATFLPLDSIRYREQQELNAAVRESGAIGIASTLTETSDELQSLNSYLLGNILVVDNIDNAIRIAGKYKHSLRIVTLDGEQLSPGGSMSGGAYRNSSKLMGRSREIAELEENTGRIKARIESIRAAAEKHERLIAEKSAEIDELTAKLKDISNERNEISYGISSDIRLRFSELRQRVGFVGENTERISSSVIKQRAELAAIEADRAECDRRMAETKRFIEDRHADIAHIDEQLRESSARIEEMTAKRLELAGQQSGFAARKDEYAASVLELQKDIIRLENQVEKEQQKLDDETEYIWNEYELSLSSAREFYDEELGNAAAVKSELAAVKNRIKGLGPVNVQAIEEYKEVSERYGFMKTQYDDLVASEASILGIIDELDAGMKKQFDEQFAAIKEQFRNVFRELFGGGEAALDLVYDQDQEDEAASDELEAGISIVVQPPGKKLQSIMQLSGGEKALTAIALMFAIQNLKPSPFCLLDEIEAALDDSNVSRFANYLHKLTEHTQFIVITHRRGTMEAADRLYGVTMQEKGITKLVSVDLISDQLS